MTEKKKKFTTVQVEVSLDLPIEADTLQEAAQQAMDYELPSEYVEDSFDPKNIRDSEGKVYDIPDNID